MGLKSNVGVLIRRGEDSERHRVKKATRREREIEVAVTLSAPAHAKDCWRALEARREMWDHFSRGAFRRSQPC